MSKPHPLTTLPALLLLVIGLPLSASGQMSNIDTSHISDDSFCVLRADVAKLRGFLKMGNKTLPQMAEAMKEQTNLDIMKMKTMTLQFGPGDINETEVSFAVTMEFSEDIDKDAFLAGLGGFDGSEVKFKGKTYLKPSSKHGPHIYFANAQSVTMATPKAVESVIAAGSGMGTMAGLIKSAPPGAEIQAAFRSNKGFEMFANQVFEELPPLGLPLDPRKSLMTVESGMAYMSLRSETPMFVQLDCKNKAAATQLKGLAGALLEMGKASIGPEIERKNARIEELKDVQGFERFERSSLQFLVKTLEISDMILQNAKATSTEKVVTLKVTRMGGMPQVVELFVDGMAQMMIGTRSAIEGIDGPELRDDAVEKEAKKDF